MTEPEDLVRSTTRAIAGTVRDVPPLRLSPAADELRSSAPRAGRRRRLRGWLAPVSAAAAVLAVAVSLVIIRDSSNGPVVPAAASASARTVAPPYYVAIPGSGAGSPSYGSAGSTASEQSSPRNDLVVGATATGKKLATIASPAGTVWTGVSGAADDRTFVALAEPASGRPGLAGEWYLVRLTPGPAALAFRLSPLPIEPLSDVGALALSGSGKELAIVTARSLAGDKSLCVYAVATGDRLHCWSTDDRTVFFMGAYAPGTLSPSLTWINGDKAIAFPTLGAVRLPHSNQYEARQTVRSLNLKSKGANLMTDSNVIWSQSPASPNQSAPCDGGYVTVSADGKTVSCNVVYATGVSSHSPGRWRLAWLTYPTSAAADRGGAPVVDYQVKVPAPTKPLVSGSPLWVDPSGSALLAGWGLDAVDAGEVAHFGVMSHGRFTPLPVPAGGAAGAATAIAW
jgi:hypothetical protein